MGRLSTVIIFQQSQKFLEASEREFNNAGSSIPIPGYFLASRALELALKSFLLLHGKTEHQLREIGHDLDRGLDAACELGLGDLVDIEDRDRAVISDVNRYYVSKDLEYVKTGYKSYPDPQVMLTKVRCLLDGISPAVCRWLPHD